MLSALQQVWDRVLEAQPFVIAGPRFVNIACNSKVVLHHIIELFQKGCLLAIHEKDLG